MDGTRIAYVVAIAYTLGSVLWVINGFFAWLPIAYPGTVFENETTTGNGVTAFLGVILFEIGAYFALLKVINSENSTQRRSLDGVLLSEKQAFDDSKRLFAPKNTTSKQKGEESEAGWSTISLESGSSKTLCASEPSTTPRRGAKELGVEESQSYEHMTYKWWFSWRIFRTLYIHDVGFLGCLIQFIGATIFLVTGTVALPPIITTLKQWQLNAAYWIPQIVASAFFITASVCFVLEVQKKWYRPAPRRVDWWIGLWALVGSVGFEYVAIPLMSDRIVLIIVQDVWFSWSGFW